MNKIGYILLAIIMVMGILFATTRMEYLGEIRQVEFHVGQNQNLGMFGAKKSLALEKEVNGLKAEIEKLKEEAKARDEFEAGLLDGLLLLEQDMRALESDVDSIYNRMMIPEMPMFMVPDPNPKKEA